MLALHQLLPRQGGALHAFSGPGRASRHTVCHSGCAGFSGRKSGRDFDRSLGNFSGLQGIFPALGQVVPAVQFF